MAVQRLLVDETHLGRIISNKSQGDAHKNKRPNAKDYKQLPRSEWTIVENCHEAVKSLEEHDTILQMLGARTLIPNKSKKQFHVFTGIIKCAICGSTQTFQKRNTANNEYVLHMKPCWFIDKYGKKCTNSGINVSIIEEMVLSEISKYKEQIISDTPTIEDDSPNICQVEIEEREAMLYKLTVALQRINEAYEMGDYTREQWQERKKKRETEIHNLKTEIYRLKKQEQIQKQITNDERLENVEAFFNSISSCTDNAERNSLYKTIIESITWLREGDNIEMKIHFL